MIDALLIVASLVIYTEEVYRIKESLNISEVLLRQQSLCTLETKTQKERNQRRFGLQFYEHLTEVVLALANIMSHKTMILLYIDDSS